MLINKVVGAFDPVDHHQFLVAAVDFPGTNDIEIKVIEHEDTAGAAVPIRGTNSVNIDTIGSTVDRMQAAISSFRHDLLRLDRLDQFRLERVGLGIVDIDARAAQSGDDQVATIQMRVCCRGTECAATGVPAEVMQLVPDKGQIYLVDDLAIGLGTFVEIDCQQGISFSVATIIQRGNISVCLLRGLHRHLGRRIKCGIGFQTTHDSFSFSKSWLLDGLNADLHVIRSQIKSCPSIRVRELEYTCIL